MNGYIFTLSVASVIGGFALLLSGGRLQKPLKLLITLVMLVIIVSPFTEIKRIDIGAEDMSAFTESVHYAAESAVTAEAKALAEEYISDSIYKKFGIKPLSVSISYECNGLLTLVMQSGDGIDEITAFAAELSGLETEAVYD